MGTHWVRIASSVLAGSEHTANDAYSPGEVSLRTMRLSAAMGTLRMNRYAGISTLEACVPRLFMLSVGREIFIKEQQVHCRSCSWEGTGNQLATGLIAISYQEIFLYAYRCPECSSFDTARKGRLLEFRSRHIAHPPDASHTDQELEESARYSEEYTRNGKRRV